MDSGKYKVINDPIHGLMELHPLLIEIIDTPQFQRFRNIKQLGGACFVYPGATHSRFEHSIGVAYLAGQLAENLRTRQPELNITEKDILCVQIAGLCHDLGHGPFSHLFDGFFLPKTKKPEEKKNWKHEKGSCEMFDHLVRSNKLELKIGDDKKLDEKDMTFIKEMILRPLDTKGNTDQEWPYNGREEDKAFLYDIVSNKRSGVDVDKFDYLLRDSYYLGIKTNFDYHRFMKFARVCEVEGMTGKYICNRDKEADNMYDLFQTRHSLHRRAYQHKVTKIIEHMISEAFLKADGHINIEGSDGEMFTLSTAKNDMVAYTKLTASSGGVHVANEREDRDIEALFTHTENSLKFPEYSVFEQILNSSSKELAEARKILEDIVSRRIPKFVGETRQEEPIKDKEKLISDWKKKLAGHLPGGKAEDFEVLVAKMDYGMKDKNPVEHMYFYSKFNPDEAKVITGVQETRMRTTRFSEELVRVYYKKADDMRGYLTAKQNLAMWWKEFLKPQDQGTSTQHPSTRE